MTNLFLVNVLLVPFSETVEINIGRKHKLMYVNSILDSVPVYAHSKVSECQIKAIPRTGLECSLEGPDVWFDNFPHSLQLTHFLKIQL